ncbi:Hypothetical protein P9515_14201 [Prochlorococcus marinus str. MIT 9515]|uniref:Uncharacterized protein n=1 Tax=Prochlorococcus marinus (strain MIT 9515) TaxID=167542 RepID=A2BXW6_PROM5|nr:Hypothetical protein P9515_14201 [Prochlorococcus marinus str. MIT 9515]
MMKFIIWLKIVENKIGVKNREIWRTALVIKKFKKPKTKNNLFCLFIWRLFNILHLINFT